jgi:hypothetical protein
MKIRKDVLLGALSKVKVGLSDKAIIDQTDHFIFDKDYVRTYNDQVAVSFPLATGLSMAIKASGFYKLISKIQAEEINMDIVENQLELLAGRTKAKISIASEIKCPAVPISKNKNWRQLPSDFADGLKFCSFSADKNMLIQELTCLWITADNILSSDNWRATKFYLDGKIDSPFLLPAVSARTLAKYAPVDYLLEQAWVHFKNKEGAIFSSRTVAGVYPEAIWSLFEVDGDKVVLPSGLQASVDTATALVEKNEEDFIELSVQSGQMLCKGKGVGWEVEEEYQIRCRKNFEIKVSPEALVEILAHTSEMIVGENKLFFGGDKFEHVICVN